MKSRKALSLLLTAAMSISLLSACGKEEVKPSGNGPTDASQPGTTITPSQENNNSNVVTPDPNLKPGAQPDNFNPETLTYEAENGTMLGNCQVQGEYVNGLNNDGDGVKVSIAIEEEGFYDLTFVNNSNGQYKENYVTVDNEQVGRAVSEAVKDYQNSTLKRIYLTKGAHDVTLSKYWGYVDYDKLIVAGSEPLPDDLYTVDTELNNKNATPETKRVFEYLTSIYGKLFLSGQNGDKGLGSMELHAIKLATGGVADGKFPAVLGLDLMDYSPSRIEMGGDGAEKFITGERKASVDYAIDYWNKGGLITMCWHWNAPSKYITGKWYSGFYNDSVNIDLGKIMNGEDPEGYDLLMSDIDAIAVQLKRLQDAGVPILFRPLHEASGGWFWWGASGPEAYLKLYKILYDKLTNEHGLNNLIWVWNGQDPEWYPGDEYCDIVGTDIYPGEKVYTSQINSFLATRESCGGKKMVYLTENGCLFDPDLAIRDGAMWGMWCTWGGEFVIQNNTNKLSDQYTEAAKLTEFYNNPYVVTLDELPNFKE